MTSSRAEGQGMSRPRESFTFSRRRESISLRARRIQRRMILYNGLPRGAGNDIGIA